MAKINISDEIAYDRKTVFETFRDHLTELLPYLPTVENITVEKREEEDGQVDIVNLWKASGEEVPRIAQAFIKPDMLQWHDYATWKNETWTCHWEMKVGFLPGAVTCKGTTRYDEKNGKTKIIMDGDLKVDASKIPGVPRLVAGRVGDAVEGFVVKLITPNLTEVNRGMEKYLAKK
ncbi:MAG: DUF2505 family protein [Bradymonadaceae bacterium]